MNFTYSSLTDAIQSLPTGLVIKKYPKVYFKWYTLIREGCIQKSPDPDKQVFMMMHD